MIVPPDGKLRLGSTDTTLNFMSCNQECAKSNCIVSRGIFSIEYVNNLYVIGRRTISIWAKVKLITF